MNGRFHFEVDLPKTTYSLNRAACVQLLEALDRFGADCGDACKRIREDLRLALAVDAADAENQEPVVTETITYQARITPQAEKKDGKTVRCAWCGEEARSLPTKKGDTGNLYACANAACSQNGRPGTIGYMYTQD
jgi:hypothetical protein